MKKRLFLIPFLLLLQAVLALPLHADDPIVNMGAYPLSSINSARIAQRFVIDIVEHVASDIGEPTLSEWTKYVFAVTCGLLLLLGIGIIILRAHIRLRMRVLAEKVIEHKRIEETLRASEERFRFLTENIADIVWTLDRDLRTTYVSPSVKKVLGFTPEERRLQTLEEMMTPDSLQRAMALFLEELERDKEQDTDPERYVTIEVEYYHTDGHTVWMENSVKALRDETGAIVGMYGSSRDITERKQAEKALQESEEKLRNIVEHSTNLFYSHTPDHVLTYLSPQTERLLGYKPEEALVRWTELVTDNPINERGLEITQRAIDTGQRQPSYELELLGKDGRKVWVEISEAPVVRDGKTVAIVGAATDVTERKRAEAGLRLERDRAQEYLNIAGVILVAMNERGEITLMNKQGCRILGYAEGELIGRNWFETCLPARVRESIAAVFERLMAKEVEPVEHYENPVLTKSKKERLIAWHNTVMMDETGKVIGTLSSGEDITERKRAEEERETILEQFKALIDNLQMGVLVETADREIIHTNQAFCDLFDIPAPEAILGTDCDVAAQGASALFQDPSQFVERIRNVLAHGRVVVNEELCLKDGRIFARDYVPVRLRGDFAGNMWIYQDITERKQAEEVLRESEARYRLLFENTPVGIFSASPQGQIVEVNPETLRIMGSPSAEATRAIDVLTFPPLVEVGYSADFRRCVETREPVIAERSYTSKWGREVCVRYHLTPILDMESQVILVQTILEDVAERRRMEEQLRQHERLAAVGQLAGGIAHDFNNLLTTIMLYAQMGLGQPNLPPNLTRSFETILDESRKAAELVQQILDFSRQAMIEVRPLDLKSFTKEVATILQRTIPESIHLTVEARPGEYVVEADPTRIQQALMNLATNARDAMPKGGELRFELSRVEVEPGVVGPVTEMRPGAWVCLAISDTGTGMTENVRSRLFEPFFTTKEVGKGTGLGLAQVYGIVRQHGGYIGAETKVGKGTAFRIYLPASESEGKEEVEETAMDIPPGQGETILLVEDKGELREAGQEILQSLGYLVLVAANGREALEVYQAAEQVDLVITDLVMPEMGGRELMQELWKTTPTLKGLAITGYIIEEEARELKETGLLDVVYKPFEMDTMARIIRRVLDED